MSEKMFEDYERDRWPLTDQISGKGAGTFEHWQLSKCVIDWLIIQFV